MDVNITPRTMPYSLEAEQAVLGSVLIDRHCLNAAIEKIAPDDFYYEQNRLIYLAMIELSDLSMPIDIVTVTGQLEKSAHLDAAGGSNYLVKLATSIITTANLDYYIDILREKSTLRKLIETSNKISQMSYDSTEDVNDILLKSEQLIYDVRDGKELDSLLHIKNILIESYEQLQKLAQNKGKITGIPSGFMALDKKTSGFQNSDLILIAARPAMGKTSFALNIAEYAAISANMPVAIFNLEMSKLQLANRMLCSEAMVSGEKLRSGDLNEQDFLDIARILPKISKAPIYIDDTSTVTVSEIMAKCRRLKEDKTQGLGMVIIDYLQLMQGKNKKSENRQQEISEISRSLKIMAKELNIPVIACSQLSRGVESRENKRPLLSDLRESGAIEQDADIVMFLYRDEVYNKDVEDNKNKAECIIAKHRNGDVGTVNLIWSGEYTKFFDVDNVHAES